MRKIIQIAYGESVVDDNASGTLHALCNDGSVWFRVNPWEDEHKWHRLDTSALNEDLCANCNGSFEDSSNPCVCESAKTLVEKLQGIKTT